MTGERHLSSAAQALLDRGRGAGEPSEDDQKRIGIALVAAGIPALSANAAAAASSAAAASTSAAAGKAGVVSSVAAAKTGGVAKVVAIAKGTAISATTKTLIAGTVLATAVGGVVIALSPAEPVAQPDPVAETAVLTEPQASPELAPSFPEPTANRVEAVEEKQPEPAATQTVRTAKPKSKHAPTNDLAAESALLAKAQTLLGRGKAQQAIAALSQHRTRFPKGALRQERDVALVLAYCAADDPERAKTIAKRFGKQFPDSPHRARLEATCAGDSQTDEGTKEP